MGVASGYGQHYQHIRRIKMQPNGRLLNIDHYAGNSVARNEPSLLQPSMGFCNMNNPCRLDIGRGC